MMTINVDMDRLLEIARQMMDGHVKYGLGSKAPSLSCEPSAIKSIDCSGFVRYIIYKATSGAVHMPDGSWIQHDWCKLQKLPTADYKTEAMKLDNWLRIAFLPKHEKHPGHVWLVLNGKTLESHGHKGPDRRMWNTPALKAVNAFYVLSTSTPPILQDGFGLFAYA
jgi:hypothetical protein